MSKVENSLSRIQLIGIQIQVLKVTNFCSVSNSCTMGRPRSQKRSIVGVIVVNSGGCRVAAGYLTGHSRKGVGREWSLRIRVFETTIHKGCKSGMWKCGRVPCNVGLV